MWDYRMSPGLSISPLLSNNVINLFIALCTFFTQSFKNDSRTTEMWGPPSCPEHSHATRWTSNPRHKAGQTHLYLEVLRLGAVQSLQVWMEFVHVMEHWWRKGPWLSKSSYPTWHGLPIVLQTHQQTPELDYSTIPCILHGAPVLSFSWDSLWILCNRSLISSLELGIEGTSFPFVFVVFHLLQHACLSPLSRKQLTLGFRLVASHRDASTGEPLWKGPESPWYSRSCPDWSLG